MSTAQDQMKPSTFETKHDNQSKTSQPARTYLRTPQELFYITPQELINLKTMAEQGDEQSEIEYHIHRSTAAPFDYNQTKEQRTQIAQQNAPVIKESLHILQKNAENNPRVQFDLFSKTGKILSAKSSGIASSPLFANDDSNTIIANSMTDEQLARYQALRLQYFKNLRQLAEKNVEASFYLSQIYKDGYNRMRLFFSNALTDIPTQELKSYLEAQAESCLSKAAEQGFAPAQFTLSDRYRWEAKSKTIDIRLRRHWLLEAAKQGHAIAQEYLGHSYCTDQSTPEAYGDIGNTPIETYEKQQAFRWFHAAALQGMDRAKWWLADLCKKNQGLPKDFLNNDPEKLLNFIISRYESIRKTQIDNSDGDSFKTVTDYLTQIKETPLHFALHCSHNIFTILLEKFSNDVNKTAKNMMSGAQTVLDKALTLTPPDYLKINLIRARLAIDPCIKNTNQLTLFPASKQSYLLRKR